MKKDFEQTVRPPRRNRLSEELATGTAAAPQTEAQQEPAPVKEEKPEAEDRAARLTEGRTQGKRGLHAKRINMAFYSDVYDYIRITAGSLGQSMTDFVNESLRFQMQLDKEFSETIDLIERRKQRREERRREAEEGTD